MLRGSTAYKKKPCKEVRYSGIVYEAFGVDGYFVREKEKGSAKLPGVSKILRVLNERLPASRRK